VIVTGVEGFRYILQAAAVAAAAAAVTAAAVAAVAAVNGYPTLIELGKAKAVRKRNGAPPLSPAPICSFKKLKMLL